MKNVKKFVGVVLLALLFCTTISWANAEYDIKQVESTYQAWCNTIALAKGNPDKITKLYAPDAVLLPTLSAKILINRNHGLDEYFTSFTSKKNIQCKTNKILTQIYGNMAVSNGLYTFTYNEQNDKQKAVAARFTFVYKKENNDWLIVAHHSSILPKP
jgi:uncharacterized protein (TIGR02246 family)